MTNSEFQKKLDLLENRVAKLEEKLKPNTNETNYKFKLGDKVKSICSGAIGIIKQIRKTPYLNYLVDFNSHEILKNENELEPYTEPRWTFTDDEKVILRNLPEKYKWLARDKIGNLTIYCYKTPHKNDIYENWVNGSDRYSAFLFNHLFQSIKWTDEEPCEFRKYL